MKKHLLIASCLVAGFGLSACNDSVIQSPTAATGITSLTGVVLKGSISNGSVKVTDAQGTLFTGKTDPNGAYNIAIPGGVAPFTVTVTGGIDNITGKAPDLPLETIVTTKVTPVASVINANINVFSTIVATTAQAAAAAHGTTPAQELANQQVTILTELAMGLPAGINPATDTTAANAGFIASANEALAEVIRRTTVNNTSTAAATIATIAADASDGTFDGVAVPAAVNAAATATGATAANVTANVATVASSTAVQASKVIAEAAANSGSVNVAPIAFNPAGGAIMFGPQVPANNVATTLNNDVAAAIQTVNGAATLAPVTIVAPTTAAIATQTQTAAYTTTAASDAAAQAASIASQAAATAAATAAGANATALDIQAAATATAAANVAAQAASTTAVNNNTVLKSVVRYAPSAGASSALITAQTAVADAAAVANGQMLLDRAAQAAAAQAAAGQLLAAQTAAQAVSTQAATAQAAAQAAAQATAQAAAQAAATGIAIAGNSVTIGGQTVAISKGGVAKLTTPVTASVAAPLTVAVNLTDYYGSVARPSMVTINFAVMQNGTARQIYGSLPGATVSSTNGVVNVALPAGSSLAYSGITAAGTAAAGNINPTTAITSGNGTLTIDITALATSAGITIKPGTYNFILAIQGARVGFENGTATGMNGLLPLINAQQGRGISGTFTTF